ncbi:hypothetical protein ACFFJY_15045 [Fictibacillus aquaticus]|uniref:Uncharacterized protein n=1 Tax=Fictibacillus aquaticus TaxID=2021314 RepID=A0A235FDQ4_9BACL|nr:hypothetical protein [Fictibacillus aquaticus]OYD59530.1 hypothetical protein CGZ90_06460 [Fictibacillus aquaticus]
MTDFHCCATCVNFLAQKTPAGMRYYCVRLKYETKPQYKFNCWEPKDQVKQLMNKKNKGSEA